MTTGPSDRLTPMRLLVLSLALLAARPAFPQARPTTFLLEETSIVSGTAGQFEPAQENYCASTVKAGAPFCLVFSSTIFGESNRYLTFLPFASFAHFDQGKYAESGFTLEQEHALAGSPAAQSHFSAIALEPELSFVHTSNNARPLNLFVEYDLRPGSVEAFFALIRQTMLPAARKSGAPAFEVFRTLAGASPDRVFLVTRLDSFAQLDHLPYTYDNPAWQDFQSKNIAHATSYVLQYRPEISANPNDPTP